MSIIPLFLVPLVIYCIPAICGGIVISWLFKVKLGGDLFVFVLAPICFWLAGTFLFSGKSLTNYIYEPLMLVAAVLVLVTVQGALSKQVKISQKTLKTWLIVVAISITLSVILFVPALPE